MSPFVREVVSHEGDQPEFATTLAVLWRQEAYYVPGICPK